MKRIISPIDEPYRVSQWFGERPEFYKPFGFLGHPGRDYAVLEGTPVRCVADGKVIGFKISNEGWGIHVRVQHDGFQTLYAHLSDLRVVDDCFVEQGQTLGRSGNTGNSSGPHLHFGIREKGQMDNGFRGYIDPHPYFEKEIPLTNNKKTDSVQEQGESESSESAPPRTKINDSEEHKKPIIVPPFDLRGESQTPPTNKINKLVKTLIKIFLAVINIIYTDKHSSTKKKK